MSIFGRRNAEPASLRAQEPPSGATDAGSLPLAAIAFCTRRGIDPVPMAYETVYTYLAGGDAALERAMNAELANGPLTAHALAKLHEEHLHQGKVMHGIGALGSDLGREVAQMSDAVDAGIAAGSSAKSALARLTESLENAPSHQALFEQAGEIRDIGLRQLAANIELRETLRVTRSRLSLLERDLARHVQEANTDHLSKLPNRRAIDARLAATFARPMTAAPACLIMVDIDNFKPINDTHGHDIGDSVIRLTADLLRREVGAKGFSARWGGEEFCVLVEDEGLAAALKLAEATRRRLEAARWIRKRDGVSLGIVTASFGLAERRAEDTPETLSKRADAALYRAKSEGRNRCVVFGDEADL